jgi:hypothetical protein
VTITTTNESTVNFDNSRWSIGLAREVEWLRLNREDNLVVVRLPDGREVHRGVADLVAAYRPGTVVSGRRNSDDQLVQGIVTERSAVGLTVWTPAGADWYAWANGAAARWTENVSPALQEAVRSFWQHHRDALQEEARRWQEVRRQHEEWKASLVSDAHEKANEHGYCSDFDDFMESHGLPRRVYDYDVEVQVQVINTHTVTIRVTAEDHDHARETVDQDQVESAYRQKTGNYDEIHDWDVTDTEKV